MGFDDRIPPERTRNRQDLFWTHVDSAPLVTGQQHEARRHAEWGRKTRADVVRLELRDVASEEGLPRWRLPIIRRDWAPVDNPLTTMASSSSSDRP